MGCRLWGHTELDIMKRLSNSSSTSRLHSHNIDHSPETVLPPTMFLQVSALNLIPGLSIFDELFGLFLINSLTVHQSNAGTAPSCSQQPVIPMLGKGSKQSPLRPVTHLSGWRELGAQHRMTFSHKGCRRDVEGGADARVMKNAQFLFEMSLSWEYLFVKCGCHSLSNSSYHRAPNCILLHTAQQVYVICLYRDSSMSEGTTAVEKKLAPGC